MTKQTLRADIAARVKNLSPVYCREADEAICRWVVRTDVYEKAQTIFCYIGTDREIDTLRLIHVMMRDGKSVAVPLCVGEGVMEARQIAGVGNLVTGRGMGAAVPFALAIIERLQGKDAACRMAENIVYRA